MLLMHMSRNVKYPLINLEFSWQIFRKFSNIKCHENPFIESLVIPCGQTEKDLTKFFTILRIHLKLMDRWLAVLKCHHCHHHLTNMELGQFLGHSGLAHLKVSLSPLVSSACWSSFLVFSVIDYGAFCLYVATNCFCIPVFCPKLELYLVLLQSLCLFYNLSKCILLFCSYMSSLLLLFFLNLLL